MFSNSKPAFVHTKNIEIDISFVEKSTTAHSDLANFKIRGKSPMQATPDLSKKGVPILPLYKVVKDHLEEHRAGILPVDDTSNLRKAIKAGIVKLQIHLDKALGSDYPLICAVLHPAIRLS
ncbi:hypothetical protein C8R45DRAFT_1114742 [Mycena sanguinolenta]|nr:hypothetical protein C8R45DRAFT_1114742 [Mycena sanguinolenta]